MIVVKIEVWPMGIEERARPIGNITIANDGTGDEEKGNYLAALSHAGFYYGKRKEPWKKGAVKDHPRKLSPYHLVHKAISACLGPNK